MAQHDIAKEIMEIAELRGQTVEEVIISIDEDKIDDFGDGEIIAWNRRTENEVKSELKKARKEATRKQAKENFHWVKVDGEWLVNGDFEGKEKGDIIEVYKVDGSSEEKVIVEFAVDADISGLVRAADLNDRLDIPRTEEQGEAGEMKEEVEVAEETTLDLEKVQSVIDDETITYGDIVDFTGMSKGAIRPYRIGERPITKMQIENALKFQELYDKKQKEMEKMKGIKELSWEEFMSLDEVQVEGDELFYNDGEIQVSVDFQPKVIDENDEVVQEGHDDTTLWEDEELAEELQELVLEEMEN